MSDCFRLNLMNCFYLDGDIRSLRSSLQLCMIKISILTVLLEWPGFGRFIFQEAGPSIDFREEYHHWEGNLFPQTSFPTLAVSFLGNTLCGPGLLEH